MFRGLLELRASSHSIDVPSKVDTLTALRTEVTLKFMLESVETLMMSIVTPSNGEERTRGKGYSSPIRNGCEATTDLFTSQNKLPPISVPIHVKTAGPGQKLVPVASGCDVSVSIGAPVSR